MKFDYKYIIVLLLALVYVFYFKKDTKEDHFTIEETAYVAAKGYVKQKLRAKDLEAIAFPEKPTNIISYKRYQNGVQLGRFTINSFVEYKNKAGEIEKSEFSCTILIDGQVPGYKNLQINDVGFYEGKSLTGYY